MSDNQKLVLAALITATLTLGAVYIFDDSGDVTTSPETEAKPVNETVGDYIEANDFDRARSYLKQQEGTMSDAHFETQSNRIDTLESYSDFYGSGDAEARSRMLASVKTSIDNYFTIIDSETSSDIEKANAYLSVGFVYTETWSDKELLLHIAEKLGLEYTLPDNPLQQATVFIELFSRSIELLPSQDAYIKRAWFTSRLLLTQDFADDAAKRTELVASIESDLAESNARNGMRFVLSSRYYNSYTALAFADVLDFLYQEGRLDSYAEVNYAYSQALSTAEGEYVGDDIVRDIIRMNYAASVYRAEGSLVDNQKVIEILSPVATSIRNYSQNTSLNYEGILIMLRGVPQLQNQNNASVHAIFSTYATFRDIPALLEWTPVTNTGNESSFVFKLI
jgi:hypothetical protein